MTRFRHLLAASALGFATAAFAQPGGAEPSGAKSTDKADLLVVHEWGTFTCLQDETGRALGGVNTDDEPVPEFVHRLSNSLLTGPGQLAPVYYKGVPRFHPDIVMRLETPVMYFYPPAGRNTPLEVDVTVSFRGGWLTEFYPHADVSSPRLKDGRFRFGRLAPDALGALEWERLNVGVASEGPETDAHVWLAPRKVAAASLRSDGGESEKYLFYRGVANLQAPLRVVRDTRPGQLAIQRQSAPGREESAQFVTGPMWLVDIRPDGAVAYRSVDPSADRRDGLIATCAAEFDASAYAPRHLARLRTEMRDALIRDGLYADESDAMLSTWELSYFKSPGMRLFFLVPQTWTDAVLPLRFSVPAEVTRTMVGRIEIVTAGQRELLRTIAESNIADPAWLSNLVRARGDLKAEWKQVWEGRTRLSDLDVPMPADYRAYVALGRFRNALVLDELAHRPREGLRAFAERYRLRYFVPPRPEGFANVDE